VTSISPKPGSSPQKVLKSAWLDGGSEEILGFGKYGYQSQVIGVHEHFKFLKEVNE